MNPNHQASATVQDSWYEVFVLICFCFILNVMLFIITKQLHFSLNSIVPEVLWLVQMQVCKLKPCDQILWREDASCWQPLAAVLVLYFSVLS